MAEDPPSDEKEVVEAENTGDSGKSSQYLGTYTSKITNVTKDKQFVSPAKTESIKAKDIGGGGGIKLPHILENIGVHYQ